MPRFTRRALSAGAAALLAIAVAACGATPADDAQPGARSEFRGVTVEPVIERPDFVLTDVDGQPFDFRARTAGKVALLFFGYTNCPDVCPVQLTNIATVLDRFPYDVRSKVDVVFVTTDPERDTPERMREWLGAIDPTFIGLRGDSAQVAHIQHGLMMPVAVRQATPDGGYMVGHSAQVVAFSPDGPARVIYPSGIRQEDWEHDIPKLVAGAGSK